MVAVALLEFTQLALAHDRIALRVDNAECGLFVRHVRSLDHIAQHAPVLRTERGHGSVFACALHRTVAAEQFRKKVLRNAFVSVAPVERPQLRIALPKRGIDDRAQRLALVRHIRRGDQLDQPCPVLAAQHAHLAQHLIHSLPLQLLIGLAGPDHPLQAVQHRLCIGFLVDFGLGDDIQRFSLRGVIQLRPLDDGAHPLPVGDAQAAEFLTAVGAAGACAKRGKEMLIHEFPRPAPVVISHALFQPVVILAVLIAQLEHLGLVGNVLRRFDHGEQSVPVLTAVDHVDLLFGDPRLADQKIGQRPRAGSGQLQVALARPVRRGHADHPYPVDHVIGIRQDLPQGADEQFHLSAVVHERRIDRAFPQAEVNRGRYLLRLRTLSRGRSCRLTVPGQRTAQGEGQQQR